MFYFKSANGAIALATSALEAQLINTTEISASERVFSQKLLRWGCNVVRQGVNSTQVRVNIRSVRDVTACRATEAGSRGGETSTKGLMVGAERLGASCEDVGDLMHPAGPRVSPEYLSL